MTTVLVVLGTFIATTASNVLMVRYYLRLGFQLGRDDLALDPGESTGRLPVGESSGKHAAIEWPTAEPEAEKFEAVPAEVRA